MRVVGVRFCGSDCVEYVQMCDGRLCVCRHVLFLTFDAFFDAAGTKTCAVVDIFDASAGTWHTAQLSVARSDLSATSLPSQGLALFAGGTLDELDTKISAVVDIFDANARTWHTAQLSVARFTLSATSLPSQGLALFAGGGGALMWK